MNRDDDTIRADLSAYLDGQLPPEQAARVERALAADGDLRAELKALEAIRRLVGDLPREQAPADMLEAVMERAERERLLRAPEPTAQGRRFRWIRGIAAAAIIVLTVGLGLHLHHVLSEDDWVSQQPKTAHGPSEGGEPFARDIPEPGATTSWSRAPEPPGLAAGSAPAPRPVREKGDDGEARRGRSARKTVETPASVADTDGVTESAVAAGLQVDAIADRPEAAAPPAPQPVPPPSLTDVLSRGRTVAHEAEYGQMAAPTEVVTLAVADVEQTAAQVRRWLQAKGLSPMVASPEAVRRRDRARMVARNAFYREDVQANAVEVTFHVSAREAPTIIDGVRAMAAPHPPEAVAAAVRLRSDPIVLSQRAEPDARVPVMHGPPPAGSDGYRRRPAPPATPHRPPPDAGPVGGISGGTLIEDYLGGPDTRRRGGAAGRAVGEAAPHAWLRDVLNSTPHAVSPEPATKPADTQPADTQPASTQPGAMMGRVTKVIVRIEPAEQPPPATGPASQPATP